MNTSIESFISKHNQVLNAFQIVGIQRFLIFIIFIEQRCLVTFATAAVSMEKMILPLLQKTILPETRKTTEHRD
jgi:hypothetical protein